MTRKIQICASFDEQTIDDLQDIVAVSKQKIIHLIPILVIEALEHRQGTGIVERLDDHDNRILRLEKKAPSTGA